MDTQDIINNTYRVESEIGAGGGGTVYKAWHTRLQKHVVIKEQKSGIGDSIEIRRNEAEALKNVRNPFLPHVYDFITEGSRSFTVMEYIEGESFDSLLRQGCIFSRNEAVRWYGQLASALEELHSKSIYHRDIKPSNIMLTTDGDACLIDFNSAFIAGNTVRLLSRSPGYASPEQYELYEKVKKGCDVQMGGKNTGHNGCAPGRAVYGSPGGSGELSFDCDGRTVLSGDGSLLTGFPNGDIRVQAPIAGADQMADRIDWVRSDIYSLGAAMYHILTGERPQEKGSGDAAPLKYRRGDAGIARIIERSTRPDPSERFASATELSEAIRSVRKRGNAERANLMSDKMFFICGVMAIMNTAIILAATVHALPTKPYNLHRGG